MRIFISYGHLEHGDFVRRISEEVRKKTNGTIDLWVDNKNIPYDSHWRSEITKAIINSFAVIAFLSKYSSREESVCLNELALAIAAKHGMLRSILLEKPETNVFEPPAMASEYQWRDMSDYKIYRDKGEEAFSAYISDKADMIINMINSGEIRKFNRDLKTLRSKLFLPSIPADLDSFDRLIKNEMSGRIWLKDKVEQWVNSSDSKRVLMIYGKPGSGKTMFCAHLRHYTGFTAAALSFDYQSSEYSDTDTVIRWLAYKLAMRLPDYRNLLIAMTSDKNFRIGSGKDLFRKIIAAPLSECSINGKRQKMAIIIDALDEARSDELADFVNNYIDSFSPWVKFIITSRKKPEITEKFNMYDEIDLDSYNSDTDRDLKIYYENRLGAALDGYPDKDKFTERLVEASEGVFTYAKCVCMNIIDDLKEYGVSLMDYKLPKGLDNLFSSTLDRRFRNNKEDYKKFWREPIGMIISSPEPMPAETLRGLMGWSENQFNDFINPLFSLFSIENDRFHVFHRSFAEWLGSTKTEYKAAVHDGIRSTAERGFGRYKNGGSDALDEYTLLYTASMLKESAMNKEYAEITGDKSFRGAVYNKAFCLYHYDNRYKRAFAMISAFRDIVEPLSEQDPDCQLYKSELADAYRLITLIYMYEDKFSEAEISNNKFYRIIKSFPDKSSGSADHLMYMADYYHTLGNINNGKNDFKESESNFDVSIGIMEKITEADPENTTAKVELFSALMDKSTTLLIKKDPDKALAAINKTYSTVKDLCKFNPENTLYKEAMADCLSTRSKIHTEREDFSNAITDINKSLSLYESLSEEFPDEPKYPLYISTGMCELSSLKYIHNGESIKHVETALKKSVSVIKSMTEKYPENATYQINLYNAYFNLANAYMNSDEETDADYPKAEEILRDAIKLSKYLCSAHPENSAYKKDLMNIYKSMSKCLMKQYKYEEAAESYEELTEIYRYFLKKKPDNPDLLFELSDCLNENSICLKCVYDGISEKSYEKTQIGDVTCLGKININMSEKSNEAIIQKADEKSREAYKIGQKLTKKYKRNEVYFYAHAKSCINTAVICESMGNHLRALKITEEALEICNDLVKKHFKNPIYQHTLSSALLCYFNITGESKYLYRAIKAAEVCPDDLPCQVMLMRLNEIKQFIRKE